MRLSIAISILACASAHAFSDSSPFLMLSSTELTQPASAQPTAPQLQSSSQVLAKVKSLVDSCPTERYLLVSQPNVHAADIRCTAGAVSCRRAPNLKRASASYAVLSVAEVLGRLSFEDFSVYIKAACLAQGKQASVSEHTLRELPTSKGSAARAAVLAESDQEFGDILDKAKSEGDFTLIYFSDPNEFKPYEADFVEPVRMELTKRQSVDSLLGIRAADDANAHLGLFYKYQFFTPGIFMALLTLFVLLLIVYVGLSALSSLQVSYGAFEKEMGPAAQKKHA